jgi:hypothetical protein
VANQTDDSARELRREARATKRAIDKLDPRERRFSFLASIAAVLFGVAIYFVETDNKNFRLAKGQLTPQTTLILGIACGALLFGATYLGRRAPVGFVALFTFLMFGTSTIFLGLPFLALAAWLLYRSYKMQKEGAAKLRAERSQATSRPATKRAGSGPARPSAGSAGSRKKGPAQPEANKRYTPKRPPPPAPKPSRRQRKATEAAD